MLNQRMILIIFLMNGITDFNVGNPMPQTSTTLWDGKRDSYENSDDSEMVTLAYLSCVTTCAT